MTGEPPDGRGAEELGLGIVQVELPGQEVLPRPVLPFLVVDLGTLGVRRKEVAEAMLGALALFAASDDLRPAVDSRTNKLYRLDAIAKHSSAPLLAGLGVEVLILHLEDRAGDKPRLIGVERRESVDDLSHLLPAQSLDRLFAVCGAMRSASAGD